MLTLLRVQHPGFFPAGATAVLCSIGVSQVAERDELHPVAARKAACALDRPRGSAAFLFDPDAPLQILSGSTIWLNSRAGIVPDDAIEFFL